MHFTSHGNKIVPFQCNICKFIMACLWRGYHLMSLFASTSWEKLIKRAPGNCYTAKLTSYHDKLSHGQTDQLSWQTEKMKSLDSNRVEITQCRFYWQFWFLGSDFSISNQAAEVQLDKIRLSFTLCSFFFFFFFFDNFITDCKMNSQIKFLCQASHVQRMPKTEALQCDLKTLFSKCWVVFKIHSGDLVLNYLNTFCVLWRSFTMEHRDEQKLETNKNLWSLTNKTTDEPSKK